MWSPGRTKTASEDMVRCRLLFCVKATERESALWSCSALRCLGTIIFFGASHIGMIGRISDKIDSTARARLIGSPPIAAPRGVCSLH